MVHVGAEKFEACVLRPHFFQGTVEMPPGIWMFHEPNWQMFNTGKESSNIKLTIAKYSYASV